MRAGVTNRIHGVIISAGELAVFLLPFAAAQYLPLYFYGSLLAVFGWEIAGDCECACPRALLHVLILFAQRQAYSTGLGS
jgi:hypothetical protein